MTLTGAIVVFLTSLSALPVSYTFNKISNIKDQRLILITGLLSFTLVAGVPWMILRRKLQKVDSFFYVLSLLTFSSVLSLIIALENDGLIAEFMGHYLREGEPYLKTAHGTMISYWDGIAHYALYLMMLAALSWNQSFYDVGLYWVGSFAYSKCVLVLAVFMSKEGLSWPFLLNFPCIVICVMVAMRFLNEKYEESCRIQEDIKNEEKDLLLKLRKRPLDIALIIYYVFAVCVTIFRFIAVMDGNVQIVNIYKERIEPYLTDPIPYPKAQLMVQTLYFVPYYMMNIYALIVPGQSWVLRWSLIQAGAAGQGQFSYMGSSFHYRTPYIYRVPQTGLARLLFWLINGAMFAGPQLAAFRYLSQPQFFLRDQAVSTQEQTTPVSNGKAVLSTSNKKSD
ncbi:transmembrane 6 superfamily member 1-like [Physella acuta]|uniref:transmembrane 6 superfamily member 1-like n=1 Tax=Physella acuta TaxID=109671 RepID=UPI0027DBD432|nr:transmembrane 6 superfamily member 1-like [Physella acuta]XP_059176415.1 transmembrane 6 superfamily member 1-like [Physella acuta]XP_059176424.1 transmembrane 6 superfamily member 1-like [Physella acuta]XP_059176435.1 transmembrane 6 superfamily member 1-like [Physella acuta]XP_059176443.1 transmembrane 6 superfamily member 1-like [Physella acuta]XP_059176451.1 transmembrane 6 superfamily member 1-like [Physella acuta]